MMNFYRLQRITLNYIYLVVWTVYLRNKNSIIPVMNIIRITRILYRKVTKHMQIFARFEASNVLLSNGMIC
jgi:hypothetical protein